MFGQSWTRLRLNSHDESLPNPQTASCPDRLHFNSRTRSLTPPQGTTTRPEHQSARRFGYRDSSNHQVEVLGVRSPLSHPRRTSFRQVPVFTPKGPRDFQVMGPGEVASTAVQHASASVRLSRSEARASAPTSPRQWRLPILVFFSFGVLGGGSSSRSLGLSLARYDSPSMTRS